MLIIDYSLDMFRASLCPKLVETVVNNQHLELTINHLYCCILLVFFLHALLTMHGHRNIKYLCVRTTCCLHLQDGKKSVKVRQEVLRSNIKSTTET